MYITYTVKNGTEYASLATSVRNGFKVTKQYTNLGKVIDKKHGIYKSRSRGIFHYDLASNTYSKPDFSTLDIPVDYPQAPKPSTESLILDFGDAFFLDEFEKQSGFAGVLNKVNVHNRDTLKSMIAYYIFCHASNCHARTWWEGSYSRILYPAATMDSQRISEFLAELGSEGCFRDFFRAYHPFIKSSADAGENILIDSTGLPNNIHFPLAAVSNHNGEINREVRLIYVTQQETGLPIYFRYCPGNVIDASTLVRTMSELEDHGISTKSAILDAGYYNTDNIRELYLHGVSFVTRLKENLRLYKRLVSEYLPSLETMENFVSYNSRYAYIKCVECMLTDDCPGYAYIGLDIERKNSESHKLFQRAREKKLTDAEVFNLMGRQGIFIIVSSEKMEKDKILPAYYTRQQIEQVFDIGKNYADMLPLRVQNEDTFRGHLLLTFAACIILKLIQDRLSKTKYNPVSMFMNLRNQKCKVYGNEIVTTEAFKKINDCYKLFDIQCPTTLTTS